MGRKDYAPVRPRLARDDIAHIMAQARKGYMHLYPEVTGLTEDESIDLIAVTWIGRGDFRAGEFSSAWSLANRRHRGEAARYILSAPNLDGLLRNGLSALQSRPA